MQYRDIVSIEPS